MHYVAIVQMMQAHEHWIFSVSMAEPAHMGCQTKPASVCRVAFTGTLWLSHRTQGNCAYFTVGPP